MTHKRGFSLIELTVSCLIFMTLSALIFSFFRYGTRSFQKANQKHGLQSDALRSLESLQNELKRSSRTSVDVLSDSSREMTVDGTPVHRDVISFATLKEWGDKTNSENYDLETGAPKWNRYWVFYATKAEQGHFIKLKVDPNPAPEASIKLPRADLDRLCYDNPDTNSFSGQTPAYVTLAKNVVNFEIGAPERGSYPVSLKLKEKHQVEATEPGARRPYDYYELRLRITPENSFPNNN